MWSVRELFILSDLHLAAERGGGFQADTQLAACLRWILAEGRDSLVVLAGDVLDFLVSSNGKKATGFDLGERTREILDHHPEVFEGLGELARSPRHRLVIMGGNHDPELIFPAVQETVERGLGLSFTNPVIRWLVQGEALRLCVGNAVVLIEHGNVLDPWNRIDHSSLRSAFSLGSRNLLCASDYQPPLGSRLALEVMNELRHSFHWIDCLKPETEALLPLLMHFASRQQESILGLADDYLSMKTSALNRMNSPNPEKLYKGGKETEDSPRDQAFKAWVRGAYERKGPAIGNNRKDSNPVERLRLVSGQDAYFEIDEPDYSSPYLRPVFERGTDLVVHGHTHSAKAYPIGNGLYLNTGTWCQLMRLPKSYESDQVWQDFLEILKADKVNGFRRPTLAHVRHIQKQNMTEAALLEWRESGPETLAWRVFSDRETGWQEEV